jgi:alpha-D-ribose 1-methylphosphonate 5-triphosphate synthase subunit PhnH
MVRESGFDDVFDSQAVFRMLLDSMSRPGKICRLPSHPYKAPPQGFCPPALSILKTLCDHRVTFSIGGVHARAEWIRYLEVNLASSFRNVEKADYVLLDGASYDGAFALLNRGSVEFPESSATALLSVTALAEGVDSSEAPICDLVLTGPGVDGKTRLSVSGLDPAYAAERSRTNRHYPLGIDLFLVDPEGRVAGIPRTSTVETA